MRIRALTIFLVTGMALLTACGEKSTGTGPDQEAVRVRVAKATYQSVPVIVEAPGTVQPRNRVALASQINGFVRETKVRAGDRVKAGQVLITLDARDAENQKAAAESAVREAQAALSEAQQGYQGALEMQTGSKASMELASQTFARYQKLFESRSVSPQEMDEIRTRRDAAQADLASRQSMVAAAKERVKQVEAKISQARAQAGRTDVLLSYTRIVAPEPGIVVQKSVDAGSAIFPGTPLLTIDTTGRPQVLASLPVEQAGILHVGMQCRLRGSQSAPYIQGRVAEIIPLSDPATHSIQFKVDLDGNSGVIHGEYLKLEIPAGTRDAMLVQRSALVTKGQLEGVLVVEGGNTARFRLVKTAPYDAEKLEILSGVEQGESIIIHSESQIIDGMPVEIEL